MESPVVGEETLVYRLLELVAVLILAMDNSL